MNNNDSNINALGEKIRTVFYFVDDLEYEGTDGYKDMCQKGQIELRTIVFARKQRAIYKGGDMYCPMEDETFKNILLRMLDDEDVIDALIQFIKKHRNNLPIASREELGAIIVGVTLDIAENGTLNINEESIRNIIKNYINDAESNDIPKASKDQYGVVKIGNGIDVDNGVISVSFNGLDERTQQELLELLVQFFQKYYKQLCATTTRYGVVKIKPNGGILVSDGVISIDPNAVVTPGNVPQPIDYSINSFSLNGNYLTISQNNNNRSLVVDLSQYISVNPNPGQDGSGNGGHYEFAFKNWETKPEPPAAGTSIANLTDGWTTTPSDPAENSYTWMSWCFVNGITGEYGTWANPIRITGSKGTDGKDGVDGEGGANITVEQINEITEQTINEIKNQIQEENNYWNSWVDNEINNAITRILHDLNNQDWYTIMNSSGWDEEMKAYLQRIGLLEVYEDENTGETHVRDRFSEIIQRLQSIEATVGDINVATDDQGNLLNVNQLKTDIATWLENNDEFKGALAHSIQSYIDWDAIGNTVTSAVSALESRAGLTEDGLEALQKQTTRVDNGEDITLSLIKALSNEQRSSINLTTSFSEYQTDGYGNYIYYDEKTDGYGMVYESDSDGKAIPYCGVKLFYVTENGELTSDASQGVNKTQLTRLKDGNGRVRLWNKDGQELDLDTATSLEKSEAVPHWETVQVLDNNGNPVKDRKGKMVYYTADEHGNYIDNEHFVYEENLQHDSNGDLVWSRDNLYLVKFINEPGGRTIAYRKNRKMRNISFSDLTLGADEESAWNSLISNYSSWNDVGNKVDSSTYLTAVASLNDAITGLGTRVSKTETDITGLNTWTTNASTTFVSQSTYNDDKDTFVTKGGIISAITASSENKDGLVATLSGAGVLTEADLTNANSTLYAEFAGVRSSIENKVGFVDGKIQSGVKINADQINIDATHQLDLSAQDIRIDAENVDNLASKIDARAANVTVKSLSATDGTSTVTANADGITIKPTSSTTSISLNKDGSGNVASGNISWDVNGKVTIKNFNLPEYNNVLFIHSDTDYATNVTALANGSSTAPILHTTFNYVTFINGIAYRYFSPLASDTSSYNGTSAFAQQLKQNNPTMFTPGSKVLLVDFHTNTYKGNTPTRYIQMAGNDASWDNYKTLCTALENASGAYSQVGNNSYITW